MIEIKINIDDIDYGSLAEVILPLMKEKAANGELPVWAKLAFISGGMNCDAVRKIIDKIPNNKKEEFIVNLLNGKKDKTAEFLEKIAENNGLNMKIQNLEIRKV